MRTVVVDGANGFVGSNFIAHVLLRYPEVPVVGLARGDQGRTIDAIRSSVVAAGDPVPLEMLEVHPYDLARDDLGLSDLAREAAFGTSCDYWHVAADVRLSSVGNDDQIATNVLGTGNTLATFSSHADDRSRYFHVSTVYTCGLTDGTVYEEWHSSAPPSSFRTYYEMTKREAELLVRQALRSNRIDGAVLRLGQVVGSSITGRTSNSYGIYDFLSTLKRLTARHPNASIRLEAASDASLNLVPVDRCVEWMAQISSSDAWPVQPIFHLVDRPGVEVARILAAVERHLPVRLSSVAPQHWQATQLTMLERAVSARLTYTGRYITEPLDFSRENLDTLVGPGMSIVDDAVLDRLVSSYVNDGLMLVG